MSEQDESLKSEMLHFLEGEAQRKEFTFRNGPAEILPDLTPEKISIDGNIQAPLDFWNAQGNLYQEKQCQVIINKEKYSITLLMNTRTKYIDTVKGSLVMNPYLKEFGIDTTKRYTAKELAKFLNRRKRFFYDDFKFMEVYRSLSSLKAKVHQDIEKETDFRGNKRELFDQTVESNCPEFFELNIEIFKGGYPKEIFKVEIFFETDDNEIFIWLESPVLEEALEKQAEEIISEIESQFAEDGLAVINLN